MKKRAAMISNLSFGFALAFFAVSSGVLWSQAADKLPSVQEILDRYVAATGGRETLLRHKSMTMRGHNHDFASNVDVDGVFYTKDGKSFQKARFSSGKVSLSGYDGQISWNLDSTGKVTIDEGDVIKTAARDADMYYHLHVMNYFRSMKVVDVKDFNGRPCYHLKGVNNWGKQNEQFYDKENGLLVGYAFNTAWRGGKGDATALFEDYKEFGGVLIATKNTSRDGDDLSVFTITSVTFDDVDDSVFTLPEAVRKGIAAGQPSNQK